MNNRNTHGFTPTFILQRIRTLTGGDAALEHRAMREITQELILYHLATTDFFKHAFFMGGTCLRIFHNLDRFSENLDFSLQEQDSTFKWDRFIDGLPAFLSLFGYEASITMNYSEHSPVKRAIVKDSSAGMLLRLGYTDHSDMKQTVTIRLEIDTIPPSFGTHESHPIVFPAQNIIATYDLATLFAGKLHALLCREYAKGRDWYDFVWYTGQPRSLVNYDYLASALNQAGPWKGLIPVEHGQTAIDRSWLIDQMEKRITQIDIPFIIRDIMPFVRTPVQQSFIASWSQSFLLSRLEKIL